MDTNPVIIKQISDDMSKTFHIDAGSLLVSSFKTTPGLP
jgi:hypothetical protein